jgi:hypothetical protein
MNDIDRASAPGAELMWEVDGDEYRLLTVTDVSGGPERVAAGALEGLVADIRELLCCSRLEAEHVLRIIMEDGEFIASVREDIDGLPTFGG